MDSALTLFFFSWIPILRTHPSLSLSLFIFSSTEEKFALRHKHSWRSRQMEITSQCPPSAPYSGALPTCKLSSSFPFFSFPPLSVLFSLFTFRQCEHCDNTACSVRSPLTKNHYSVVAAPAGTQVRFSKYICAVSSSLVVLVHLILQPYSGVTM